MYITHQKNSFQGHKNITRQTGLLDTKNSFATTRTVSLTTFARQKTAKEMTIFYNNVSLLKINDFQLSSYLFWVKIFFKNFTDINYVLY